MKVVISCQFEDTNHMAILLAGCEAHSDFEYEDLHCNEHESAWHGTFLTRQALMTFAELLETIDFKFPDLVRFVLIGKETGAMISGVAEFCRFAAHESKKD